MHISFPTPLHVPSLHSQATVQTSSLDNRQQSFLDSHSDLDPQNTTIAEFTNTADPDETAHNGFVCLILDALRPNKQLWSCWDVSVTSSPILWDFYATLK